MTRIFFLIHLIFITLFSYSQLPVAYDTISVKENGKVLKMPWANGLNYSNFSNIDLNFDNVKDLVAFDKTNQFGVGRFRCYIKTGIIGAETYSYSPGLSYYFPEAVNWATFVDYDCDGKEDLFCSASGGIMVYKNTSSLPAGISFSLTSSLLYTYYSPSASGYANLYAGPAGVPGIADVDKDGDIDVLTFSPQGIFIEFHRNMSMEAYGDCHSLDTFNLGTGCWGKMTENSCTVDLNQTCAFKEWPDYHPELQNPLHSGSCLTCIDIDADSDLDLIMGDISCNSVQFAYNGGTASNALITDTTKLYPNYPNKNSTTQIKMNNFPCTYNVDVNGDGKKDLIATPNTFGSENAASVWYYRNTSSTSTVNFQYVKNNFLQDEMIEVGQNSYPAVFDYNADGKKDLLIGTFGYYNSSNLKAQLALYENTGTLSQPSYSLVTRDYAGVSTQSLSYVIPSTGDLDGDGDIDIVIGTSNGKIHWLKNGAGAGNICSFTFLNNPFTFTTQSAVAAPQIVDIDKDGKPDLMIGGKNGRIAFYKNIGSPTVPSFTLVNNFFGNVDVKGDPNLYGIDGYAAPYFYDEAGVTKLLVGSVSGQIFYYTVPAVITNSCVLISNYVNAVNEGAQSSVCYEDINNDGKRDLLVGNASGGLNFFSSKSPYVGIPDFQKNTNNMVAFFPVPAEDKVTLEISKIEAERAEVRIINVLGKEVLSLSFNGNTGTIDISGLNKGLYIVTINIYSGGNILATSKKLIKN
ncbi:MAG: hypothetical protein JWO32_1396 [Bacteroidetes bacterium]|nr:hypothetical protein [Bacteroidota bacterium]